MAHDGRVEEGIGVKSLEFVGETGIRSVGVRVAVEGNAGEVGFDRERVGVKEREGDEQNRN